MDLKEKVFGWIGTGAMGNPMCKHLITKGYKVLVHNRTESRA